MNKASVIAYAKQLARCSDLDDDTLDIYYDDVMETIAKDANAPFMDAAQFTITSGTATYDYASDALVLHAVFVHDKILAPARVSDLEAYNDAWRSLSDTPYAMTEDELTARTFMLIPNPDTTSDSLIPVHGEPFGEDYPDNIGVQLYAESPDDLPDWVSTCVALRILALDFARPSEYQDVAFAEACTKLAEVFWKGTGL